MDRGVDLLAQMATFVRVAEGRSLSAAARSQRLSLAAVSRQIRALEVDLGVTLVARTTRRLALTAEGQRWYEHCVRVLAEVERARASVSSSKGAFGSLAVSAPVSLGLARVVPRLPGLLAAHPRLDVELRLEDRVVDLVGEGVDVAVRGGVRPPDSAAIVAQPLFTFARVAVVAPSYLERRRPPRTPADLPKHDCLVQAGPTGPLATLRLTKGPEERTVIVPHRFRCNAPIALRDAARRGAGIALLADWLVDEDLADGRLVRVLPEWTSAPVTAWALYRVESRTSPRVRAFVDAMRSGAP